MGMERRRKQVYVNTRCPYCNVKMINTPKETGCNLPPNTITIDHIIPKDWFRAGTDYTLSRTTNALHKPHRFTKEDIPLDCHRRFNEKSKIVNCRYVCSECNELRGQSKYNHCPAAMILDRLINGDERFYNVS